MVQQVANRRYKFGDPCIICGDIPYNDPRCSHQFTEVHTLITRIKKLTPEQNGIIYRREYGKVKSKSDLEAQAAELVAKAEEMLEAAKQIRQEAATRYEYPKQPDFQYGVISVKFRGGYSTYKFVLFMPRLNGPIFTTGQQENTTKFKDWGAFIDWLRSDDVIWNSTLDRLTLSTTTVPVP